MRTTIEFFVDNAFPASPTGGAAYVSDRDIYTSIWRIATKPFGWDIKYQTDSCLVKAAPDEPHLAEILVLLKKAGWSPFYGEFVPHDLVSSRFWVRRLRHYEKSDRETAAYFSLGHWGGREHMFTGDGMDGELCRGKVAGAKWKKRVGYAWPGRLPRFVNDDFKNELVAENLLGLTFLPVLWDYPKKAKGNFWQISSDIAMPACLLPVINVPQTRQPWTTYDDGGHFPQELVFRQSEVKAIEPFDVALTSPEEAIHCGPNSWTRNVIVSQRFRQVLNKLKVTNAELVPVHFVSDDWQRPLSDHDRLRSECAEMKH